MKRKTKNLIVILPLSALILAAAVLGPQLYVVKSTGDDIFTADSFKSENKADCIIVLGPA